LQSLAKEQQQMIPETETRWTAEGTLDIREEEKGKEDIRQ
jgi:hypothetical protein